MRSSATEPLKDPVTPGDIPEAEALLSQGRAADALKITSRLVAEPAPTHQALATHAFTLKALRRLQEALAFNEQATRDYAQSPIAWHNLAATLGDLGRVEAAIPAVTRAMALGLDRGPTWHVYARALLATGAMDEAERAYRETLKRPPLTLEATAELANVIWMRRGDMAAAQAVLDEAFRAGGPPGPLVIAKAKLFEAAGDVEASARLLSAAVERMPGDLVVLLAAAQSAIELGYRKEGWELAKTAESMAGDEPAVLNQLAIAELARGAPGEALAVARRGLAIAPEHQSLIGWAAAAARAAGDPLYETLYDYDAFVGVYEIETPSGWPSLAAYLTDLAATLNRMHPYEQHPFHQSIRHGSQTMQPLTASTDPVLGAFFEAVDKPIRAHMKRLGKGSDPFRRRNASDYHFDTAWSVLLRPGGFHKDHFHPQGWISSAFYVETPEGALDTAEKQGWIRFGRPPLELDPPMAPARYVRPKPGRLVLFPSYMWHGTEPFTTDERRMTIAFDAVPA